jgi:hypothetical protein
LEARENGWQKWRARRAFRLHEAKRQKDENQSAPDDTNDDGGSDGIIPVHGSPSLSPIYSEFEVIKKDRRRSPPSQISIYRFRDRGAFIVVARSNGDDLPASLLAHFAPSSLQAQIDPSLQILTCNDRANVAMFLEDSEGWGFLECLKCLMRHGLAI